MLILETAENPEKQNEEVRISPEVIFVSIL